MDHHFMWSWPIYGYLFMAGVGAGAVAISAFVQLRGPSGNLGERYFEIAKYGFAAYILNFRSYQLIYGALATVPIFFLWIYLSWLVMLVGAVVAAVLKLRTLPSTTP